jgi:hypothetical protein
MRKPRLDIKLDFFDTPSPAERTCEQEGCAGKGEFRAPKTPHNLRDYYWFCLDHVRNYNKSWDFYRGMNSEEIESSRVSDVTWNRPSWPLGSWRTLLEKTQWCDGLDTFMKGAQPHPSLPPEIQKALSTLDLSFPLTQETLKNQYKKLVKCHHPDLHAGDKLAEERLKAINTAYQTVKKYLLNDSFTKPIAH